MSYQVHITSTAEHDIMRAADYIEFTLKNPDAADNLLDAATEQSNLGKTAMGGKLSDRPAERTSLQEKLAAMKARVSGTPAGRDAVDKTKGKEMHELISVSPA